MKAARQPCKVSIQAITSNLGWHTPPTECALQEERSQVLWQALERIIPDIRARAELVLTGSPLTHEFWLNRHKGTYGPAISAAGGAFPGPSTPVNGLYRYSQCLFFPCQPCVVTLRGLCVAATCRFSSLVHEAQGLLVVSRNISSPRSDFICMLHFDRHSYLHAGVGIAVLLALGSLRQQQVA